MSEPETVPVDVGAWVDAARPDPVRHSQRQCTEIILSAIGISDNLRSILILKGGTLMALAFRSSRVTADVDFTAQADPADFADQLADELDAALPLAARKLNYLDMICRVQSVTRKPRPQNFNELDFPALLIKVGYAKKGTAQEAALGRNNASQVVELDISFRDQVYHFQELWLADAAVAIRAFTLSELIAEKFRALLQQKQGIRNRDRRQDVYDINYLQQQSEVPQELKPEILATLRKKCRSRGIVPTSDSLDAEIRDRARREWDTIRLELGELPDFEVAFAKTEQLYRSLPWGL